LSGVRGQKVVGFLTAQTRVEICERDLRRENRFARPPCGKVIRMRQPFSNSARAVMLWAVWPALMVLGRQAVSAEPLEARVEALLARNCLECHNGSDRKGGLDLTRREAALKGGDSGKAIEPGDGKKSLLIERVNDGEMPPKERPPLTVDDRKLLQEWITAGAKWASDPIDPFRYSTERRAGYDWWSLQPVRAIAPPAEHTVGAKIPGISPSRLARWRKSPVDRFLLAKLEAAQLAPATEADRRTLIRRLYFDVLGLPPSPEEVAVFVADTDSRSYEKLVDKLLASPHYGERWSRHWLDIVRYGESQGFERNKLRPNAWKYRDYVVEAFNSDQPYDEFIRWQIAGDVIRPDDPLAMIASGFLVLGPYDLTAYNNGTPDMRKFAREEELEGLVATVGQTFLGLTINCSRCHDHKFDPITQREFYQISAALGGTYHGDERESRSPKAKEASEAHVAALKAKLDNLDSEETGWRLKSVTRLLSGGPAHLTVPKQPGPWHVLARGDFRSPGEKVGPRGIASVSDVSANWSLKEDSPEAERRKALANWIADAKNPLTPRVIVNRLWGYHFGDGLVRTPSDFGFQGGQPSHPELLDWLAHELVHPNAKDAKPWSLKHIHRLILNSAAYKQSGRGDEKGKQLDADNRLLWKRSPRRLEAEAFRDTVLAVAGELDRRMGGPGFRDFEVSSAGNNETYTVFEAVGGEFNRRSIYRTTLRTGTHPLLDMLDCPDPSVATPRRPVTSTPLQALSLLNSHFMEHYAGKLAERVRAETGDDVGDQVRRAYSIAFVRLPNADEVTFGQNFVKEHSLRQFCLVLLNANEFLYVD
jgi:mono/diheme cytochrome c family protein